MTLRHLVCWLTISVLTGTALAEKDPVTGRFLQRDPVGTGAAIIDDTTFHGRAPRVVIYRPDGLVQYADGMNLYEFVKSNPINLTDPLGTWTYTELGVTMGVQGLLGGLFSGAINSAMGGSFGQGFAGGFIGGALGGGAGFFANSAFAASASGLWATFAAHSLVGAADGAVSAFGQSYYSTLDLRSALADAAFGAAVGGATGGLVDWAVRPIKRLIFPAWVRDAGSFVNFCRNLERARARLTAAEADELVREARRYGVSFRLDPPHPNTPWDVPHLNIGDRGVHVEVPPGWRP